MVPTFSRLAVHVSLGLSGLPLRVVEQRCEDSCNTAGLFVLASVILSGARRQ